jgi:hypothetical protein
LPNIVHLLHIFFPIGALSRRDPELISAVLILAAAVTKWTNEIFPDHLFLDFLRHLHEFGEDVASTAQVLYGRAFPRGRRALASPGRIATFAVGDAVPSLVTVSKADSLVLEVRDSRGLFVWEIVSRSQKRPSTAFALATELPPPRPFGSQDLGDDWEGVAEPIAGPRVDSEFSQFFDFSEQSHLASRAADHPLRHNAVDFFIESGLFLSAWKIEGDANDVIDRFDAIDDTAVLRIPVFHFGVAGEMPEETQLFRRFFSLLGEVARVEMGLITFEFHRASVAGTKADIGVVFTECPMRVNTRHQSLPKCDLLFYICPGDGKLYRIWCQCKNSQFWSHVMQYRIIARDDILRSISVTVFQYVALFKRGMLFEKDEERKDFLQNVPRSRIGALELIETMG